MARRFFVTLVSVAQGDIVSSMAVGDRLDLPRNGKIECGRVPGLDIVCRGQGQGGRRCFGLAVDGERVVMNDYRHGMGIWVRGKRVHQNHDLAPGDAFGPCEGIRFVLGVEDAPVLHDVQRVGRWWCANPRGEREHEKVWSAIDLTDPDRTVVDVVFVPPDEAWDAGTTCGAFVDVLHPSWPVCVERFAFGDLHVRVGERTAGIPLHRLVARTKAVGAIVDAGMAAWLAESIGWAMLTSRCVFAHLDRCVAVRFDDGQPILEPSALRIGAVDDQPPTWHLASVLRDFAFVPPNDRCARALAGASALAAADEVTSGRAVLVELLEALAQMREESGGDMRAAWHGLVQRLFPEDAAVDRDVVDALRLLSEQDALALLSG